MFNIFQEFERQGVDRSTMRPAENPNGNICSTYPEILYVPTRASDEMVFKSSRFRSKERLAVLSYCYRQNVGGQTVRSYLFRASQCKVNLCQKTNKKNNPNKIVFSSYMHTFMHHFINSLNDLSNNLYFLLFLLFSQDLEMCNVAQKMRNI